ncbi:MAG: isoprenylcysteine carboxylmethyltransferase family protein [Synergistaceae bacterium]|nr:isoprenylcysteine carboxylmethyltransferase family protein [Synergistaceae bacterium]
MTGGFRPAQRVSCRAWIFRMRGGLWTLLYLVILVLADKPTLRALSAGLGLVAAGQLWRFWAAGSIGRYRGEKVGAERLTTWGPYALMRNPLYFGNGLIGLGWGIMAGPWAALVFVAGFIVLYGMMIIPYEESFLLERFGAEYENYRKTTGAFYPRSWPGGRLKGAFDAGILWRSERHTVLTTVVGTCLIAARVYL